jgi:hypothetical protein
LEEALPKSGNLQPAPPFEPGNGLAVTHGSYSRLRLSEEAGETAAVVRELVPVGHVADTPTIEAFAVEQLRRAAAALEQASENGQRAKLLRLSQDAQGWANVALRYARELGLSPRSRSELGLALARTAAATRSTYDMRRLTSEEALELDRLLRKAHSDD